MRLFGGSGSEHPTTAKARKRLNRVSPEEALRWADVTGAGMARSLSEYQKTTHPEHLDDAEQALLTLLGCVQSLRSRTLQVS